MNMERMRNRARSLSLSAPRNILRRMSLHRVRNEMRNARHGAEDRNENDGEHDNGDNHEDSEVRVEDHNHHSYHQAQSRVVSIVMGVDLKTSKFPSPFLEAEQRESDAQREYAKVLAKMDLFSKLIKMINGSKAMEALEDVSKAADDSEMQDPPPSLPPPPPPEVSTTGINVPRLSPFPQTRGESPRKPKKTMSKALNKLQKSLEGRFGAMEDLKGLPSMDDPQCRIMIHAAEAILAQKTESAQTLRTAAQEQLLRIQKVKADFETRLSELRTKSKEMESELEKWERRKNEASDRVEIEAQREREWADDQIGPNEAAMEIMRAYMPEGLSLMTKEQLIDAAKQSGKVLYTPELADRLKKKRFLHWLVMHPDDIQMQDFLGDAQVRCHFTEFQEYDVVEMRALFGVVPKTFSRDTGGFKKAWRDSFMDALKNAIQRESMSDGTGIQQEGESVQGVSNVKQMLIEHPLRNNAYRYPTEDETKKVKESFVQKESSLDECKKRVKELQGECERTNNEYQLALKRSRDPKLKQQFGKEALKTAKDEAKNKFESTKRSLKQEENKESLLRQRVEKLRPTMQQLERDEQEIEQDGLKGKPIPPAFPGEKKLKKQAGPMKKDSLQQPTIEVQSEYSSLKFTQNQKMLENLFAKRGNTGSHSSQKKRMCP